MTKEEVKEEMKSIEGDPTVKARLRSRMRQYAMRRSLADVKKLPWSSRTLRNMLWPYVMKKAWLLPSWSLKVLDGWLSGSKMRHVGIMYPW